MPKHPYGFLCPFGIADALRVYGTLTVMENEPAATDVYVALFTAAEFAKRIGMSEDWVRRNAKTLHHHRVGRLLRFSDESVEDFKMRTAVQVADPLRRTERSRNTRRK